MVHVHLPDIFPVVWPIDSIADLYGTYLYKYFPLYQDTWYGQLIVLLTFMVHIYINTSHYIRTCGCETKTWLIHNNQYQLIKYLDIHFLCLKVHVLILTASQHPYIYIYTRSWYIMTCHFNYKTCRGFHWTLNIFFHKNMISYITRSILVISYKATRMLQPFSYTVMDFIVL